MRRRSANLDERVGASLLHASTCEILEYYRISAGLQAWEGDWFWPTPRTLDILNILCPSLKKIIIGSTVGVLLPPHDCWCATQKAGPAWHTTCAISRFHNLQCITIHVEIDEFRLQYMDPIVGREATRDAYQRIQEQKCGRSLRKLTIVLSTLVSNLFGQVHFNSRMERITVSFKTGGGYKANGETYSACSDPSIGDLLNARKQSAERAGFAAWQRHIGPYLWERRRGHRALPRPRQLEWLIRMALPPKFSNCSKGKDHLPETLIGRASPSSG